ncbi:MAG: hypothetical protein CMJ83_00765 [Planctomycetes bacterium]|nr:hypothetical protein [Planctomycetota bacterium]
MPPRPPAKRPLTWNAVRALAAAFPEVEDGTSYGTPALKVKKKLMVRLKEDGETIVVRIDFADRELLMQAKPKTFFITDHYRDHPAMLVALSKVTKPALCDVLETAWRYAAPKRLVARYDGEG